MNQTAIDLLIAEKRLRRLSKPPFDQVDRLIAACRKDLKNVRKFLAIDESKAFDVSYDVIFKSALALMRSHGYRPAAMLQHKTTVEFCEAALDSSWKATLDYFDDMRRKRNRLTYEADVIIGRPEAEAAITEAETFHASVAKMVEALRPPSNS